MSIKLRSRGRVARFTRVAALAFVGLGALAIPTAAAPRGGTVPDRAGIEAAVYDAVSATRGGWLREDACLDVVHASPDGEWAFGTVALPTPRVTEPLNAEDARLRDVLPEGRLWMARREGHAWHAELGDSDAFRALVRQAPESLFSGDERRILASAPQPDAAGNPAGDLSLPWNPNESWTLRGGPHGWTGDPRPWSSLDFQGGSSQVVAARAGVAYRMCSVGGGWIRVDHGDGWTTDYYHLSSLAVNSGQYVTRRQYLGQTGTNIDCGGSASGPHVHFTIRYNGAYQEWNGREIGGWTLYEGAASYQGRAERAYNGGNTVVTALTGQTLYNAGVQYQGNVQNYGWTAPQANWSGDPNSNVALVGTVGQGLRLEAINISLQKPSGTPANLGICYSAHVQNYGWMAEVCNGQTAGTLGQGLRMEAIRIRLVNPPNRMRVCYRAHVQNYGWMGEVCDNTIAGTTGQSLRIEALQIRLTP